MGKGPAPASTNSEAFPISMGDVQRKKNRQQQFLKLHPSCIYCGAGATTTDHCPPRCFFEKRLWPETYEFPACQPCNAEARLDEQGLAVLIRTPLTETRSEPDQQEWERLVRGVRNNQPHLITEWNDMTRNEIKRDLRQTFGREQGDLLRQRGWGLAKIGPQTRAMITRFMIKLSKALYYKHNGHVFDGVIYINHINRAARGTTPDYMENILRIAPELAAVERNRKPLAEQFIYRFNHSPENRVMYAVVQFGDQFIFQLVAMSLEMDAKLVELNKGLDLPKIGRHECFLMGSETRNPD
jgi:hypothetical protein